jgi:uncharacterized protein YukE
LYGVLKRVRKVLEASGHVGATFGHIFAIFGLIGRLERLGAGVKAGGPVLADKHNFRALQGTFRERSGNIQGTLRNIEEHGGTWRNMEEHSGNVEEHSGDIQGTLRNIEEHLGTLRNIEEH